MSALTTDQPGEFRTFRVIGLVRFADGLPASGTKVAAFDTDLRSEKPLGESQADRNGAYRIEYSESLLVNKQRGSADLVVKVFDAENSILAASPVLFDAREDAEVDLTIPNERRPALFERISLALEPVLGRVKVENSRSLSVEELEENQEHQDLTFLSGETGFEKSALARFVLAHHLATLGIDKEFWFALLGGLFFDYVEKESLQAKLAALLGSLPSLDAMAVREILDRSLTNREIRDALREEIGKWIEAFLLLITRRSLGDAKSPTFERMCLEHAGIASAEKQERFASVFIRHKALTPELLAELEKDESFTKAEIADLRSSYHLAELTRGDFSVVEMLKNEFGIRTPEQIRTLSKLSESQWVELIVRHYKEGEIKLPLDLGELAIGVRLPETELYAKTLARQFREAFPTAAFAGDLTRAVSNGAVRGLRHPELLSRILDHYPEFDLLRTSVDEFLPNVNRSEFPDLAEDEGVRHELKAVQRLFKLAPTLEATDAILADGVHSAQMVYRMGQSEFVRRYGSRAGFSPDGARLAWNRAADTHAAMLTIIGDLKALDADTLPIVLKSGSGALTKFPNWDNLFKSGDLCHCEHCRSALSPAAYFTDLLMFLRDRKAADHDFTVKDILFKRRPDLGYLELNCENALATMPYVDLVCEVLEHAVDAVGDNDLELKGFTTIPGDPAVAKTAVAKALNAAFNDAANTSKEKVALGADFSLSQVDPADSNRWVVHGEDVTYLLKKKATDNFFAELLPNTKASKDELRAYPAYVNPRTYGKLKSENYPLSVPLDLFAESDPRRNEQRRRSFSLPFDLFAEEVRAAFKKCNLQRWDLMGTLRGSASPNNPTDGEIAAEYFDISCDAAATFDEKRLILVAETTVAGQQAVWGEIGNAGWLEKMDAAGNTIKNSLCNVKTFLQKTGLEYEELLALFDLPFIKAAGEIVIEPLDGSCDTDKKVIQGLNAANLDLIHRFLRMWRKLSGWNMWELDLVIRCDGIGRGKLDESFLVNLQYFDRLKSRLGPKATVEELCALFGNLSTDTHFTKLHEKRAEGLYQSLFLNAKITQPLDPACKVAATKITGPTLEKISHHRPVILAALSARETDLDLFAGLTRATNGVSYITDDLTLTNLSFLWRHVWLAKRLKFNADEWKTVLKLLHQDVETFADPKKAWEFVERVEKLKATGFTPDELNWLLTADRSAKAARKETDAARFLVAMRKELQNVRAENDPAQAANGEAEQLTALLISLLQKLNRTENEVSFFLAVLRGPVFLQADVRTLPMGFVFPREITDAPNYIPILYDEAGQTLRFTGVLKANQKETLLTDASLAAVTANVKYQSAIEELSRQANDAVSRFASVEVSVTLEGGVTLPQNRPSIPLLYDATSKKLRFLGVMTTDEQRALKSIPENPATKIDELFDLPRLAVKSLAPGRIWLTETDLDVTLPANDTLGKRLANAAAKALEYLRQTAAENAVVQQASVQLGLTPDVIRLLLTRYALLPETLLEHLTVTFAGTTGTVDHSTLKTTFDGWYWADRVATIWKKWKLTLADLEKILPLTEVAKLLDFLSLPLNDAEPIAATDRFLRTSCLVCFKDSLPENGITMLEVLELLRGGKYTAVADFAKDVQRLNPAWSARDVEAISGALDLAYPNGFLVAENWERLRRVFYFVENLNAGVCTLKIFAAATMTEVHTKTLKELLCSKFGVDTWLTLITEIQDALRERKRDALAAYLLTRLKPGDVPTGKWENTNDLYAYYLLDVEIGSCQLTSRLVQASGSVQLFVQRCFMGLEPDVKVQADGADGDDAWRWWKWMRKYRVWEANRKVFLWPENWIEPDLKKDRSSFFREMEKELLQNEINQSTAETAFKNYLEKLDGVAQLEIAGFHQEDDGDDTILHVFGRTKGAEPHAYYYRRYDYREWTPWEKVDLDIQGDYLVPAVINRQLFLFWPVFTEVPDETENSEMKIPQSNQTKFSPDKTKKKIKLQMAVSDYRSGKWTPKRISKDHAKSEWYHDELANQEYYFVFCDLTGTQERISIEISNSFWRDKLNPGQLSPKMIHAFDVSGNRGAPELLDALIPHVGNEPNVGNGVQWAFVPMIWPYYCGLRFSKYVERAVKQSDDLMLQCWWVNYKKTLMRTPDPYTLSTPWHLGYFDKLLFRCPEGFSMPKVLVPFGTWMPVFFSDKKRTFILLPSMEEHTGRSPTRAIHYYPDLKNTFRRRETSSDVCVLAKDTRTLVENMRFHFKTFYHALVPEFSKIAGDPQHGIPALLSRASQNKEGRLRFNDTYGPTEVVVKGPTEEFFPREIVEFGTDGSYSTYNWELFFHAPLLIANSLSRNQRFEEAREWYHFIFNPIGVESAIPGGSVMSKYWITKPFFETTDPAYLQQRIENIMRMLAGDTNVPGYSADAKKALEVQVRDWRTKPFEPHRIANYRTVAYQKTVVMKYLDNLIAWGDNLFRQDSMESINEATQLYILAAELLGPRPRKIPAKVKPPLESFNELEKQLDAFANALVEVENLNLAQAGSEQFGPETAPLPTLYFCIPHNEKMLGYWDTIADRLYKIRHCMNIEGVVRQLALFEPPIDPGALVKAAAAGVDIGAALTDLNASLPLYRFNILLQKANEVCNDVKALGAALLSALEKKDGEALSLLRQGEEIRVLEAVKAVREKQIEEANENLEALRKSKVTVETRRNYYRDIPRLIAQEQLHLDKLGESHTRQEAAQGVKLGASIISILPAIDLGASGFGGSPVAKFKIGGLELGQAANLASDVLSFIAQIAANDAAMASSKAGFDRRWDDWKLQEHIADRELDQLDRQIAAAQLRVSIAEKELKNHVTQIENAKAIDALMRSKYTNEELYQWQVSQISGVYFQHYKLAYDLAKRAELCLRFELGLQDSSFISFGYWDSLKKGLLSGEKLQYDLRRLESAYLEQNQREFELTKHVSLARLNPLALVRLRETGRCFFQLPEELFDLDYPGHYFRRIKSVSVTIPCVTGPYTTISCTLRLLKSTLRINTTNSDNGYPRNTDNAGLPADDPRFVEKNIPVKAIAASSGQNDSGVFELSFHDERYLPFEGAGAISEWSLELFSDIPANNPNPASPDFGRPLRQFDYSSITDAVLHVRYTAREDTGVFKNGAIAHLRDYLSKDETTPSLLALDLRRDFAMQWNRFLNPATPATGNVLEIEMSPALFPIRDTGKTLKINAIYLLARCTDPGNYGFTLTPPLPIPPPAGANTMTLAKSNTYGGLHFGQKDVADAALEIVPMAPLATWKIRVTRPGGGNLLEDPVKKAMEVEDVILVLGYEWN